MPRYSLRGLRGCGHQRADQRGGPVAAASALCSKREGNADRSAQGRLTHSIRTRCRARCRRCPHHCRCHRRLLTRLFRRHHRRTPCPTPSAPVAAVRAALPSVSSGARAPAPAAAAEYGARSRAGRCRRVRSTGYSRRTAGAPAATRLPVPRALTLLLHSYSLEPILTMIILRGSSDRRRRQVRRAASGLRHRRSAARWRPPAAAGPAAPRL